MMKNTIAEILESNIILQEVQLKGWVRTFRSNRFIALNDGSTIKNIQCVIDFENTEEATLKRITTGAALSIKGTVVESQGKGQKIEIKVDELAEGSRVTVSIMNSLDGQVYNTHAHDMANSADTPNGTPYNEAPNVDVFASPIMGVGGTARATKISSLSFNDLTTNYDGFFVIHDPLQDLSTVDPTTYVILGIFAR